MRKLLSLLLFILFCANITFAFPKQKGNVSDFEKLFSASEIAFLDSALQSYNKKLDIKIAVVTLGEQEVGTNDFEAYTLKLANHWGVGDAQKNNGIVIAISKSARKMRIQNGIGISYFFSDGATESVINYNFITYFIENRYFDGVKNGCEMLALLIPELKYIYTEALALSDSLPIWITQKDIKKISAITAAEINCHLCADEISRGSNLVPKAEFYKDYYPKIFDNDLRERIARNEKKVFPSEAQMGEVVILYTTYRNNEYGDGHEGAQFGFRFALHEGKTQIMGIESIP